MLLLPSLAGRMQLRVDYNKLAFIINNQGITIIGRDGLLDLRCTFPSEAGGSGLGVFIQSYPQVS